MKKILLICNESNAAYSFRRELIIFLIQKGYKVSIIVCDTNKINGLKSLGANCHYVPFTNRSKNIFSLRQIKASFKRIIISESPDIVFSFQLKPNILAPKTAKECGVKKCFMMIEGLGNPFQPQNLLGSAIKRYVIRKYRKSSKYTDGIFFLNADDKEEFLENKICNENITHIIHGIGIDTKSYDPDFSLPDSLVVLNMSRLIRRKGIMEYCELARLVRKQRPDITFKLYGEQFDIDISDIQPYLETGDIVYGGYVDDIAALITSSTLVCSTSYYREGFPRVALEAMALGRVVVASNIVGFKDAIINEKTGFLVEHNDLDKFALTITSVIDDKNKLIEMGKNARKICEERYDSNIINTKIVNIIEES